jgi:signal transduction histidine kinase
LERIGDVARETTAAMSDIVWAINPERDSLGGLSVRVRRFATDVFTARGIDCTVITPESDEDLKLGVEMRRQLLLIVKEAIHNAVRHAGCTEVRIELIRDRDVIVFRMEDNGAGFDPDIQRDGQGVRSMRARAKKLHGEMAIDSNSGGTRLEFRRPA